MWEIWVQSLGWEDSLEKGMATHSSGFFLSIYLFNLFILLCQTLVVPWGV